MNIENLNAEQFETSMGLIADVAEEVMGGELGEKLKGAFGEYRAEVKRAKQEDPDGAEAKANDLAVDMVADVLPDLLRQGTEISYKLLAALDGQTLEEYKACFTVKKFAEDIKAAVEGAKGLKDVLAPFFA